MPVSSMVVVAGGVGRTGVSLVAESEVNDLSDTADGVTRTDGCDDTPGSDQLRVNVMTSSVPIVQRGAIATTSEIL